MQDGIAAFKSLDAEWHYSELNGFGLMMHRHGDGGRSQITLSSGYQVAIIPAHEILCRLDQFLDSGSRFFRLLGYHGQVRFGVHLNHIDRCGLQWFIRPGEIRSGLDAEVRWEEICLAGNLEVGKEGLLLNAASRVAWGFGFDLSAELLKGFYGQTRPRAR